MWLTLKLRLVSLSMFLCVYLRPHWYYIVAVAVANEAHDPINLSVLSLKYIFRYRYRCISI